MRSILVAGLVLTFLPLASARAQEVPDSACGPSSEKFKTDTDKKSHPEPQAVPAKAVLVVVRPTMLGNKIETKFAVYGKWVGTIAAIIISSSMWTLACVSSVRK